jgi:hypothetical protein
MNKPIRFEVILAIGLSAVVAVSLRTLAASPQANSAASQRAPVLASSRGELADDPEVKTVDGGCQIAFALTAPVDVTVRILDARGEVVRHLAAGTVGRERAAKPFAAGSLSQKLFWDGKDDAGKEVPATGCRVSLGIGTGAKFDKFILYNPDGFGNIGTPNWSGLGGIAVGPKGELYVVQQYGVHYSTMRVFDRKGHFARCVWPLSMDKSREMLEPFLASTMTIWPADVAPWTAVDYEGRTVPRSVRHSAFYWFGVKSVAMAVGPEGDVFLVDAFPNFAQMLRIDGNGLPRPMKTLTPWVERGSFLRRWNLAVGPEGDVYVSDKSRGIVAHLDKTASKTVDSYTYRQMEKLDQPTYLLGEPIAGEAGLYDPLLGLAVDKEKRVWLAKPKERCIEVFDKDGRLLTTIKSIATKEGRTALAEEGIALAANHASGAIYANLQATTGRRKLVKLTSPVSPRAHAEVDLPNNARNIAADGEGDLVWVAVGSDKLLRATDAGDRFEVKMLDGMAGKTVTFPRLLHVDRQGRLYLADSSSNYVQSDVEGNAFRRFSWYGVGGHGYCASDAEGNWYVPASSRQKHEIWKLSPEGKRVKLGGQESIALENVKELKGICVTPLGDIYVAVTEPAPADTVNEVVGNVATKGEKYNFSRVDVYGPDGKLKTRDLVRLQGINDVQVDREGNIYAIEAGTCHGAHKRRAAKLDNQKFSAYNALMKFAPAGGVRDQQGHLWSFRGLSGISTYTCAGECPAGQITIDADNRIWLADAGMYCVSAVDTAGNLMFRVGAYGNEDCRGGGQDKMIPGTKIVRDPEVPLTCPFGTAVWKNDYLLISDMYSHRVLRCKLECHQQVELRLAE